MSIVGGTAAASEASRRRASRGVQQSRWEASDRVLWCKSECAGAKVTWEEKKADHVGSHDSGFARYSILGHSLRVKSLKELQFCS